MPSALLYPGFVGPGEEQVLATCLPQTYHLSELEYIKYINTQGLDKVNYCFEDVLGKQFFR
jgi:hypothetical protein